MFLPYFDDFHTFFEELAGLLHNGFVVFSGGVQPAELLRGSVDVLLDCGVEGVLGLISFPFKLESALIQLLHYFLRGAFLSSRDFTFQLRDLVSEIFLQALLGRLNSIHQFLKLLVAHYYRDKSRVACLFKYVA